jgi:hypothetical protein
LLTQIFQRLVIDAGGESYRIQRRCDRHAQVC